MTLSLNAIYQPIAEFFLQLFETNDGSSILFRFDKFGSVVSDEDFIDPAHPELGYLPALAVEKFSDLVNHIPVDTHDNINIFLSSDSIDSTYFFRLLTPALPLLPSSIDDKTKQAIIDSFSAMKANAVKLWDTIKAESITGVMLQYKPSMATPQNWYDKTKNEIWTHHSFKIEETIPIEIRVPTLGESIVNATIVSWFKKEGDTVRQGEALVELETEKVTAEVNAEHNGVLQKIVKQVGDTVGVGEVIGIINENGAGADKTQSLTELPPDTSSSDKLWALKINDDQMAKLLVADPPPTNIATRPPVTTNMPDTPASTLTALEVADRIQASLAQTQRVGVAPLEEHIINSNNQIDQNNLSLINSTRVHDNYLEQSSQLPISKKLLVNQYLGEHAPTSTVLSSSISISFDYCLVHIRRPWYVDVFINDTSWYIPTIPKGRVTSSDATGGFSLMPIGFVAIRNLNIVANWTDEDRASASHATSFGPFKVSAEIVNNMLSHEGLQIIGWMLQKLPDLPPNNALA